MLQPKIGFPELYPNYQPINKPKTTTTTTTATVTDTTTSFTTTTTLTDFVSTTATVTTTVTTTPTCACPPDTICFDDIQANDKAAPIPNGYAGLNWDNVAADGTNLDRDAVVSLPNFAFNGAGN